MTSPDRFGLGRGGVDEPSARAPGGLEGLGSGRTAGRSVRSARTRASTASSPMPATQDLSQTFLNWRFEPFGCTSPSSPPTFWRAATVPFRNQSTTSSVSSWTRFWTAL